MELFGLVVSWALWAWAAWLVWQALKENREASEYSKREQEAVRALLERALQQARDSGDVEGARMVLLQGAVVRLDLEKTR